MIKLSFCCELFKRNWIKHQYEYIDVQYTEREQLKMIDKGYYKVSFQNNAQNDTDLLLHHDVPKSDLAKSDNNIIIAGDECIQD